MILILFVVALFSSLANEKHTHTHTFIYTRIHTHIWQGIESEIRKEKNLEHLMMKSTGLLQAAVL